MLTLQNLYDDFYNSKTGLTTVDVPTTVSLPLLNQSYNELAQIIAEVNEDHLGTTLTTSCTSGASTFPVPSGTIKIKRIELTDAQGIARQVEPIDINQITSGTDATSVRASFTSSEPAYDVFGSTITVYPTLTANVTNGFKMWAISNVTALSATTDTPSFALDGFEHLLVSGAIVPIAIKLGLQELASDHKAIWEQGKIDLRRQLQNRSLEENLGFSPINENRE